MPTQVRRIKRTTKHEERPNNICIFSKANIFWRFTKFISRDDENHVARQNNIHTFDWDFALRCGLFVHEIQSEVLNSLGSGSIDQEPCTRYHQRSTVKRTFNQQNAKMEFDYPSEEAGAGVDKDGDFEVPRKKCGVIEIEHSGSTVLRLVGLQVWRGALLLADFFFHNRHDFAGKTVLELGAGVGLTSIAAGIYSKNVICTDVDIGGILDVIRANVSRNRQLLQDTVEVMEFDFKATEYLPALTSAIDKSDIIIAADVIYDDDLTECFIQVIDRILAGDTKKTKTIYIALEKRYVFTLDELETVAPCFEHFLKMIDPKPWRVEYVPTDFPQFFKYERCKHLILLKVSRR